jgi:two-component system, chemotaxis family, CheB/CheR fusion protein
MDNCTANLEIIRNLTFKLTLRDEDMFEDHELFKLLQQSTGDGYWDWDIVNNIKYMSHAYKKQLGYKPDEIENGQADADFHLCDPKIIGVVQDNLKQHFESLGKIPFSNIMEYTHKEGHIVYILCKGAVVEWDDEQPIRMVGTHVDITQLREKIKSWFDGK